MSGDGTAPQGEPNTRIRPAFAGDLHEPPRKRTMVPHALLERILDELEGL
ncbi:hypothetical protein [Actinopolyspora erythraea]|nr:hypothetical protein [Actinopolyspora erythraea]